MSLENPEGLLYKDGDELSQKKLSLDEMAKLKEEKGLSYQEGGCFGRGPGTKYNGINSNKASFFYHLKRSHQ